MWRRRAGYHGHPHEATRELVGRPFLIGYPLKAMGYFSLAKISGRITLRVRAGVERSSSMTTAGKVDLAGDGFFVLVDLLEAAKAGLPEEVPSPLDDRFSEIASAYRKADPALRQQVREQIPCRVLVAAVAVGRPVR